MKSRFKKPTTPPIMEDGKWYDLDPPAVVQGEQYGRVICEYRVPSNENEYSVRGIPEGGMKEEPFILAFTATGKVKAKLSENQGGN